MTAALYGPQGAGEVESLKVRSGCSTAWLTVTPIAAMRFTTPALACGPPSGRTTSVPLVTYVTQPGLRAWHGAWVADRYGVMTGVHRFEHSNAGVTTRHYAGRPRAR